MSSVLTYDVNDECCDGAEESNATTTEYRSSGDSVEGPALQRVGLGHVPGKHPMNRIFHGCATAAIGFALH